MVINLFEYFEDTSDIVEMKAIIRFINSQIDINACRKIKNAIDLYLTDKVVLTPLLLPEKYKTQQILTKQRFPTKMPHYDTFHILLTNKSLNAHVINNNNKIAVIVKRTPPNIKVITDGDIIVSTPSDKSMLTSVEYVVYNTITSKNKSPSRWFKYYGRNICSKEKSDDNHMFDFSLDDLLSKCSCTEVPTLDIHTGNTTALKLYFKGYIKYYDVIIKGQYEYFIDEYGVLFHRLFVPSLSSPIY